MTPEKRKKIRALMESPASTTNEKEICRQLLQDNPAPDPPVNPFGPLGGGHTHTWQAPRSQGAGDYWRKGPKSGQEWNINEARWQDPEEKSFSQKNFDEYVARQQREAASQAEENTRRQDGRARRGGPEFFKADCDDCLKPFTTWVDGPRRCRACKSQPSGQQYHSTLGDIFKDAQQTTNRFMDELARMMADDLKKERDDK